MTSLARHSGPWATFALSTVVLVLGACGRVPGQFEILNDQVPQPGCLIGVDTMVYRGRGTMDLSLVRAGSRGGYVVWPLMKNNITRADLDAVIELLRGDDPILTQSAHVRAFEEEWSYWLGVKFSVFVNSGSSANLLTMAALK